MSEYTLIFSPDLEIEPREFAAFWNAQVNLHANAIAQVKTQQSMTQYDISALAMSALAFVGGFALDVFKDVAKDAIKEYLKKHRVGTTEKPPVEFDLIEKKTEDGKTLIIVLPKEEN
jgi:hypothetical protein